MKALRELATGERTVRINPTVWTCDGCGKQGKWRTGWEWYGSYAQWDESKMLDVRVSCSEKCRVAARLAPVSQNWRVA